MPAVGIPYELDTPAADPRLVGWAWLLAIIVEGDLATAWPLTDPEFRLELASNWLTANAEHPTVKPSIERQRLAAAMLAHTPALGPLWEPFAATTVREVRGLIPDFDSGRWGAAEATRLHSIDTEVVVFVESDDRKLIAPEEAARLRQVDLAMRLHDGWVVAGLAMPERGQLRSGGAARDVAGRCAGADEGGSP